MTEDHNTIINAKDIAYQ